MKAFTRHLLSIFILIGLCVPTFAQQFEGTIEFKQTKGKKVSYYIYYVQGHKVRVEERGENKNIVDVLIVDTKDQTITLISPERKSYMEIQTVASKKKYDQQQGDTNQREKESIGI